MDRFIKINRKQSDVDKSPDKLTSDEIKKLHKDAGKLAEQEMEKMLKKAKMPFKRK